MVSSPCLSLTISSNQDREQLYKEAVLSAPKCAENRILQFTANGRTGKDADPSAPGDAYTANYTERRTMLEEGKESCLVKKEMSRTSAVI